MFLFVFLLVLFVVGLVMVFIKYRDKNPSISIIGGILSVIAFLVIIFGQCFQTVGPSDIGVILSGGRPSGDMGPGWGWIAPWQSIATMDDSVQPLDYNVADPTSGHCEILIRIANQQTACAEVKARIQLLPSATDQELKQYKTTQGVISGLVTPAVQTYANQVFQSFDPIADVNSTAPIGSPTRPTTSQLAAILQQDLTASIGQYVIIDKLSIPNIDYDSTVQAQLNAAFSQKAKTVIAQQAEQTALAQAQANKNLGSTQVSPIVLVQQCMTYLTVLADRGLTPPAGFSCWPGQGSGVVLPVSK